MATQPTQNPVPSESQRDLKFNAGKIDEFVTSLAEWYIDRFGIKHYTIEGLKQLVLEQIYALGWNLKGSFQGGGMVENPGDLLQDTTTDIWYRWDDLSSLPKTVSSGSTPASAGGTGPGKWQPVDVADVLRKDLAKPTGAGLVGFSDSLTYSSGTVGNYILQLKNEIARRSIPQLERYMAYMAAGKTVKIACYGDSTTDGNGTTDWVINETNADGTAAGKNHNATAPNTWPVRLEVLLNDMYGSSNVKVYNAGYSGKTMYDGWAYTNFDAAVTNSEFGACDIVIIDFGLNDTWSAGSQVEMHVVETLKLCLKIIDDGHLPILLTSGPDYRVDTDGGDGWDNKEVSRQINEAKISMGKELNIPVIDKAAKLKEWLNRNKNKYAWGDIQPDGLHFGDKGHFYQAGIVASVLFSDTVFVKQDSRETVGYMDSRFGSLAGRKWATDIANSRYGKTPLYPNDFITANPGIPLLEIWVFCDGADTSCVYRAIDNDAQPQTSNNATLFVQGSAARGITPYNGAPPNSGYQYGTYRYSDVPITLCKMEMGLNKVAYLAPNSTLGSGLFHGYFDFVDGWLSGIESNQQVKFRNQNLISSSGPIYHYQSSSSVVGNHQFITQNEDKNGGNIFSWGAKDGTASIMMELSIGKGYGISLLSSRGFTSGVTKYSDSGIMLYRNASGYLTLNNVTKDNDGNISFSTDIATSSALYDYSMKQLRVDFIRSPTNVQIIVYGDWNRSSTLMSLTIAAGQVLPVPRGGVFGGIYFRKEAMTTEGGLTVKSAQAVYYV